MESDCIVADSMALWGKLLAKKLNIPFISSCTTFAFNRYSAKIMKQDFKKMILSLWQMNKCKKHIQLLQDKGYPIKNVMDIIQNDNDTDTIVYTSPYFQPCSETFSDKYSFVGPSLNPPRISNSENLSQVIYISLGTVNNQVTSFYKNCIEAFKNTSFKVILSVGKFQDLHSPYENIEIYEHVNQLEILQHTSVFITHCGMNSVNEALFFHVPLILFPQTDEQSGVAYRVNELKAGTYLKENKPNIIFETVLEVLNNPQYKENAKKIAESFSQCQGSKQAAQKIIQVIHNK